MPLRVDIEFVLGAYDARSAPDPELPEWPPSPARLFCALVASADSDEELQCLRWLEAEPPPRIVATMASLGTWPRRGFVPTNQVPASPSNQHHPGRVALTRSFPRALPVRPSVTYDWEGAEVSAEQIATLAELARRVGWLGRSTSPVIVAVSG
jgi:CRISPR-associated protein Csb2